LAVTRTAASVLVTAKHDLARGLHNARLDAPSPGCPKRPDHSINYCTSFPAQGDRGSCTKQANSAGNHYERGSPGTLSDQLSQIRQTLFHDPVPYLEFEALAVK